MPLQGIAAAPVTFAAARWVTAYNVVLLACLVATGWRAAAAAALGRPWPVALAGGAMLVMLPPVHAKPRRAAAGDAGRLLATLARSSASGASPGCGAASALGVALGVTYVLCASTPCC